MNDILNDVNELKNLIMDSNEYKEYINSLDSINKNGEIKELVNKVTKLQKEIVKENSKKIDTKEKEYELKKVFDILYRIDEYNKYLYNSKELNTLITNIQKKFEDYFNSLNE